MGAVNLEFFKLVYKVPGAVFADDRSHRTAALREAKGRRKMNVDFRFFDSVGEGRLNVNERDLFDEDDDAVLERYGFHGLFFAWPFLRLPIFLGRSARHEY